MMTLQQSYVRLIVTGLFLVLGCGCKLVVSKRPIGQEPARIAGKEWEGNWLGPDGPLIIKVVDAERGMISVTWLEDDDAGKPVMKVAEVELRQSGEWIFANTKETERPVSKGYLWARIKNEERRIIVWLPDEELFAHLIRDGLLPGEVDGEDIVISELDSAQLRIVTSGERGLPFSWDKPVIFIKAGN